MSWLFASGGQRIGLWASVVGLLVTSKWTYAKMHLPGLLLPLAIHCHPTPLQETLKQSQAGLAQSPVGSHCSFLLGSDVHVSVLFSQDHPTLAFSHRVQKSVLYNSVSFTVPLIGSSLPSF